jgi:hypothetical protein
VKARPWLAPRMLPASWGASAVRLRVADLLFLLAGVRCRQIPKTNSIALANYSVVANYSVAAQSFDPTLSTPLVTWPTSSLPIRASLRHRRAAGRAVAK